MRVGIGYDAHRFGDGCGVTLGGVWIPHDRGLLGHSDADVVVHAIMDAVLGALGGKDIGMLFPNSDPQYKGISSLKLAAHVRAYVESLGLRVKHVDCTVIAEEPKVSPYYDAMVEAISTVFGLRRGAVGIKATTNEGMGFIGRKEGIAAIAVAVLEEGLAPRPS